MNPNGRKCEFCKKTIQALAMQGLTDLQVAIVTGCSRGQAGYRRRQMTLRPNSRNKTWLPDEDELLLRLLEDGDRRVDIATFLNRSYRSLMMRMRGLKQSGKHDWYHGKMERYDTVWTEIENGKSPKSVARLLGISKSTVYKIWKKRPKTVFPKGSIR